MELPLLTSENLRIKIYDMQTEQIQFISTTPEKLQELINSGIEKQFEELKKSLHPKEVEEFMTRQEVADLLKINLTTLWSWTNKKKLNSYGIEGRVYYKRSEVEKALIKL